VVTHDATRAGLTDDRKHQGGFVVGITPVLSADEALLCGRLSPIGENAQMEMIAGSSDAMREIDAFFSKTGNVVVPLTVEEILKEQPAKKLASSKNG